MNDLINFFTEPYQTASALNISLEFIAALFGVISVFYAKKENILVFPTGIISTVIYVYLLSQWNLYGDLIINIYYTIMSLYGWYMCIRLVIEDDGAGKDPQELEQLAQRGVRLDESVEGHGLGLAICKDIVKLYAGSISFGQSEALGGFQVVVNLPIGSNDESKP